MFYIFPKCLDQLSFENLEVTTADYSIYGIMFEPILKPWPVNEG